MQDPWPKPCYLFSAVAGKLSVHEGSHTIASSGKQVAVRIYTAPMYEGKVRRACSSSSSSNSYSSARCCMCLMEHLSLAACELLQQGVVLLCVRVYGGVPWRVVCCCAALPVGKLHNRKMGVLQQCSRGRHSRGSHWLMRLHVLQCTWTMWYGELVFFRNACIWRMRPAKQASSCAQSAPRGC